MNVLLVGEESAGAQTLKLVLGSAHHLVGVMASPARAAMGGMTLWQRATQSGCPTWPADRVKDPDFAALVRAHDVDILLNVHSLFVVRPQIVAAPRFGSFNLHPGPLPRYAGLNAPSWAIYRGERRHGVTLHWMRAGIDTGPIAYQTLFELDDHDTGLSVSAKCVRFGLQLIRQLLATADADPAAIPAVEQDLSQREYFGRATPDDGRLDWARPARAVFDFVRAADFAPFPSPWQSPTSSSGDQDVAFMQVALTAEACAAPPGTVAATQTGEIRVACADEWIAVVRLQVDGQATDPRAVLKPGQRLVAQR